jgi:hypothetical protein
VEKCGGAREATHDNTIRRMRFAWPVTKTIHTHIYYVYLTFNTFCMATLVTRTRLSVTLHVHCLAVYITLLNVSGSGEKEIGVAARAHEHQTACTDILLFTSPTTQQCS